MKVVLFKSSDLNKILYLFLLIIFFNFNELNSKDSNSVFHDSIYENTDIARKMWEINLSNIELDLIKNVGALVRLNEFDKALVLIQGSELENRYDNFNIKSLLTDIVLAKKYSSLSIAEINSSRIIDKILKFANENDFFEEIKILKESIERENIKENPLGKENIEYFSDQKNLEFKLKILSYKYSIFERMGKLRANNEGKEKISSKKISDIEGEIRFLVSNIWINYDLGESREIEFLKKYQYLISDVDHINRIDNLIWENKIDAANRSIVFVNEDYKKLFTALFKISENPKYINNIILSVPRYLRGYDQLLYKRAIWYKANNEQSELISILQEKISTKRPDKWWSLKHLYARELLKTKKYKEAYKIASSHDFKEDGSKYWEAEWLSGWISLRFVKKPEIAYKHFYNLYLNVKKPVTISRAAYWLGRASYDMGKKKEATSWYNIASKYPTFFYGQLAINKNHDLNLLKSQYEIILPKNPVIKNEDILKMSKLKSLKVAYLLYIMNEKGKVIRILKNTIEQLNDDGEIGLVAKLAIEFNDPEIRSVILREVAGKNVYFIKHEYKLLDIVKDSKYSPLIHSLIKQESGFKVNAQSPVGAKGYMQVMPATAKVLTRELGISYDENRLLNDAEYNVTLGSYYINKLINRFNGSEMLAIASYNAGPNSSDRWIREFFDPRETSDIDQIVDWIELITYYETRNYVQRVIENLIVYKYLMSKNNF